MNLSSGDWIAIVMGGAAIVRWCIEIVHNWVGERRQEDMADEKALVALKSAFDVHVAEDRLMYKWLKEELTNISRSVGQLQSQMRFVSTGPNDHIYGLGKNKSTGG
jgi:hypothetical protein